jgi:hypothetical protein
MNLMKKVISRNALSTKFVSQKLTLKVFLLSLLIQCACVAIGVISFLLLYGTFNKGCNWGYEDFYCGLAFILGIFAFIFVALIIAFCVTLYKLSKLLRKNGFSSIGKYTFLVIVLFPFLFLILKFSSNYIIEFVFLLLGMPLLLTISYLLFFKSQFKTRSHIVN